MTAQLIEYAQARQAELLAEIATLVAFETPSTEKKALDACADHLSKRFAALGATVERVVNPLGGDHLHIRFAPLGTPDLPPGLLLAHYDTVWGLGTIEHMPWRIEGERVYGPGVYDMKVSLGMAEAALRAVRNLSLRLPRPIEVLITSDEEIGSPTSRLLIERVARQAAYVLVLEPPIEGSWALKTARKGVGMFSMAITGRAAHAGVEPEKGISALEELAHQILALHALADKDQGTTVNVGVASGGTRSNVVAAQAKLEIDVRAWQATEAGRVTLAIMAAEPHLAGAKVEISGGFNRPPLERTPASQALFAQAQTIAAGLGLTLSEGATGGGSDGNFTAAVGTPTLDGLGVPGGGAHAEHEHILLPHLAPRTALLIALVEGL